MTVILPIFLAFLGLIIGTYWVFVVRPENRAREQLRERIELGVREEAKKKPRTESLVNKEERLSGIPFLERVLARAANVTAPLQLTIEESNLRLSLGLFMMMSACSGLLFYIVVLFFSGQPLVSLVAGAAGAMLPYMYVRRVRTARVRKFEEQFPEAVDLIARALRAGHAFSTGLGMVADEMPVPVGSEFKLLYERQNYGMSLHAALKDFARRIPLLDARFFVTAVVTQREAGGNLAEILDNLGKVIRERFKVKRQISVATAHGRITGWVLVCFPPALAVAFFFIVPENMILLGTDPLGKQMIAAALGLQVMGSLIIRKLINVEY